jgi:hypothetical protein
MFSFKHIEYCKISIQPHQYLWILNICFSRNKNSYVRSKLRSSCTLVRFSSGTGICFTTSRCINGPVQMLLSKDDRYSGCNICGTIKSANFVANTFDFGARKTHENFSNIKFYRIWISRKMCAIPKISVVNKVLQFSSKAKIYRAGYSTFGYI